jgi:hypothetical protein
MSDGTPDRTITDDTSQSAATEGDETTLRDLYHRRRSVLDGQSETATIEAVFVAEALEVDADSSLQYVFRLLEETFVVEIPIQSRMFFRFSLFKGEEEELLEFLEAVQEVSDSRDLPRVNQSFSISFTEDGEHITFDNFGGDETYSVTSVSENYAQTVDRQISITDIREVYKKYTKYQTGQTGFETVLQNPDPQGEETFTVDTEIPGETLTWEFSIPPMTEMNPDEDSAVRLIETAGGGEINYIDDYSVLVLHESEDIPSDTRRLSQTEDWVLMFPEDYKNWQGKKRRELYKAIAIAGLGLLLLGGLIVVAIAAGTNIDSFLISNGYNERDAESIQMAYYMIGVCFVMLALSSRI